MLEVKDKAHKNIFRGNWRSRPADIPHQLLLEMKYGSYLEWLSFLVHCVEPGEDVMNYETWSRRVDAERLAAEIECERGQRCEQKQSEMFKKL